MRILLYFKILWIIRKEFLMVKFVMNSTKYFSGSAQLLILISYQLPQLWPTWVGVLPSLLFLPSVSTAVNLETVLLPVHYIYFCYSIKFLFVSTYSRCSNTLLKYISCIEHVILGFGLILLNTLSYCHTNLH